MKTLTFPLRTDAPVSGPVRTGLALAATVALFYGLCSLVWLAAPGPFLDFMNALFHGIDFTTMLVVAPFSWGGFVEAWLVLSVWAFLAGTFFGWMRQRLGA